MISAVLQWGYVSEGPLPPPHLALSVTLYMCDIRHVIWWKQKDRAARHMCMGEPARANSVCLPADFYMIPSEHLYSQDDSALKYVKD